MDPASLTIVPDIKLPTVDGRQLSPENCVSSNKEVKAIFVFFPFRQGITIMLKLNVVFKWLGLLA